MREPCLEPFDVHAHIEGYDRIVVQGFPLGAKSGWSSWGTAFGSISQEPGSDVGVCTIQDIYVQDFARRRGMGTQLIGKLLSECFQKGERRGYHKVIVGHTSLSPLGERLTGKLSVLGKLLGADMELKEDPWPLIEEMRCRT